MRLRVGDIDSAQTIIRIVQAKGRKDRHVMLSPDLLGLLRQWWKVRPRRYDRGVPPSERWLFLAMPTIPSEPARAADDEPAEAPSPAYPCPACGGAMVITERFEASAQPRAPPPAKAEAP